MEELVNLLKEKGLTISSMESCTGGAFISTLTDCEGSSKVTEGSFVTYSNNAKIRAGVPSEIISTYGVYSKETAIAMANACKKANNSDIGVGITGTFSNLDTSNEDSTQNTVYIAVVYNDWEHIEVFHPFTAERYVQKQSVVKVAKESTLNLIRRSLLSTTIEGCTESQLNLRLGESSDESFILEYLPGITENVYIIEINGTPIGALEYAAMPQHKLLKVEFISIDPDYRDNHYATHSIRLLQQVYPGYEIYGECLSNETAYYFWESLGADFEMEDDFETYRKNRECIPFILH